MSSVTTQDGVTQEERALSKARWDKFREHLTLFGLNTGACFSVSHANRVFQSQDASCAICSAPFGWAPGSPGLAFTDADFELELSPDRDLLLICGPCYQFPENREAPRPAVIVRKKGSLSTGAAQRTAHSGTSGVTRYPRQQRDHAVPAGPAGKTRASAIPTYATAPSSARRIARSTTRSLSQHRRLPSVK